MITFRPLARADLPQLRDWLNTPHVFEWWGTHMGTGALGGAGVNAATVAQVEAKYGPNLDRGGPTHRFIIGLHGTPIGLIQWYHLRDFTAYAQAIDADPNSSAGLDLLIGEPSALGRGHGTQAINEFVSSVVFKNDAVDHIFAGPSANNARSIRAFEKAGFTLLRFANVAGEPFPEAVMIRSRFRPSSDQSRNTKSPQGTAAG